MESAAGQLIETLSQQFLRNANANLLTDEAESNIAIEASFLETLRRAAVAPMGEASLDSLAARAADQFISCVLAINPYVEMSRGDRGELIEIYRTSARRMIAGEHPERVLREGHYPALKTWIERKYPASLRSALKRKPTLGTIPYAQYSAELQLEVLKVNLANHRGPIVDLGCGAEARLVRFLRERGIEAYGVDRSLSEESEDYLLSASWFDYPFCPRTLSLVVSHLALSSHLLYQYNSAGPELENYVALYRTVLDALSVDGDFVYAPALPFLEEELSAEEFEVGRWRVAGEVAAARVTRRDG